MPTVGQHLDIQFGDAERIRKFRGVLDAGGYTDVAIIETLGSMETPSHRAKNLPRLLWATSQDTVLNGLIRLFLLCHPMPEEQAARVLHPMTVDEVASLGILSHEDGIVTGAIVIMPFEGAMLTCDQPWKIETGAFRDLVMGLTRSSADMLNFAVRRDVATLLDLGTGGGVLAFRAAQHAQKIYAVDKNERAVEFAIFNQHLNGVANIEFLAGDAFEPVRELRFDQIMANPPFVIGPEQRYLYRDSGHKSDLFAQKLAREAPLQLNEGGYFQMVCEWVQLKDERWQNRVESWFRGSGCDVMVWTMDTQQPAQYAEKWVRDTEQETGDEGAALYREWMDYFADEQIEAIHMGVVAMRKRTRASGNWFRIDEGLEHWNDWVGGVVEETFALGDFLLKSDDEILNSALKVRPGLRLMKQATWTPEGWKVVGAQLRQTDGMRYGGNIDEPVAALISRCDGQHQLGTLLLETAQAMGADPARVVPGYLGILRKLIERGFLLPAS